MRKSTVRAPRRLSAVHVQCTDRFAVPKAEELVAEAENAEKEGNLEKASELYM